MHLCVVSFKPCWRDGGGRWMSSGGFPLQMAAVGSLFESMTLVVVETGAAQGGLPLPAQAEVVGLRSPAGADTRRKMSVLAHLASYVRVIAAEVRRADVVHAPVPGDISLLGFAVGLLFRKRLIVRYGSSWTPTPHMTYAQRFTRVAMRLFAGGRNVMLATGSGDRPPAQGMTWIFSTALTRSELSTIDPDYERRPATPARLVYIGRLSPEKGVGNLLRGLAHLKAQTSGPLPRLSIIGDGPDRPGLEQLARALAVDELITFCGQLDRHCLAAHLRAADLCVQPSLTEGFSKAWLDAMAHGVPVISTNVGAARGVFGAPGERGWLVPPDDPPSLAVTIRRALDETEDWPALRRRCRQFVETRTLDAWADAIGQACAAQWGGVLLEGRLQA